MRGLGRCKIPQNTGESLRSVAPHPQPLSPEYQGEGSQIYAAVVECCLTPIRRATHTVSSRAPSCRREIEHFYCRHEQTHNFWGSKNDEIKKSTEFWKLFTESMLIVFCTAASIVRPLRMVADLHLLGCIPMRCIIWARRNSPLPHTEPHRCRALFQEWIPFLRFHRTGATFLQHF